MAVSVIVEWEGTVEDYEAVNAKIDSEANPPEGMIVHTGADIGGGKMRAIDVWESADAYEKFASERLGPAIGEVMGPNAPQVAPQVTELNTVITG